MSNIRSYTASECAVFMKSKEKWGELANTHSGFPVEHEGIMYGSTEALYQALKLPANSGLRELIAVNKSPLGAKYQVYDYKSQWLVLTKKQLLDNMRIVIRLKLEQHEDSFGKILLETGDKPIVEMSYKDFYWAAEPIGNKLVGVNALGRLLMERRQQYRLNKYIERL